MSAAISQQLAPDFGEPWQNELGDFEIYPRTGGDATAYAEGARTRDRVIACVNACAGMANPAAEIQAVRDALAAIERHARDLRRFKKFPESVESIACSILLKLAELKQS